MRMRDFYLDDQDCHEAGLCSNLWYKQKTHYVHYSTFTSICIPFTGCPSDISTNPYTFMV
jgi:hypothetical protein